MATDVVMPQMGESIAEGTIVRWIKKVGDKVDRDEPLFEISTDKVDAEIPVAGCRRARRDSRQGRRDGPGQQRRRGDRCSGRQRRSAAPPASRPAGAARTIRTARRSQPPAPPAARAPQLRQPPPPAAAASAHRRPKRRRCSKTAIRQRSSPLVRKIAQGTPRRHLADSAAPASPDA